MYSCINNWFLNNCIKIGADVLYSHVKINESILAGEGSILREQKNPTNNNNHKKTPQKLLSFIWLHLAVFKELTKVYF